MLVVCCSKGCCTEKGCAHHPTVAIARPIARKSTETAESIVKKECHGLLLNLCTGTQSSGIVPKLALNTLKTRLVACKSAMSHPSPVSIAMW